MADGIHDGHRKRVRKEFLENGFSESTPEHKVLEMLLFYSIPRRDTNELAHELINRFGSVSAVLDAPPKELMKIKGVSENTAALIKLILPIARMYTKNKKESALQLNDSSELYKFLSGKYIGYNKEVFAITSLSPRGTVVGFDILAEGSNSCVLVSTRKVIETVLMRNASHTVISHNHPDGNALPSSDDIVATERIVNTLRNIGIGVLDHIILVEGDYVSLRQSERFKHLFE